MGPIVDRSKERLVSSDTGIIKARQKLRKAVEALRDERSTPPGVDPAHHRIRPAAIVLPQEESFIDACQDALTAELGKAHTSV
jgi:phthalate 4,5-dioxygenase